MIKGSVMCHYNFGHYSFSMPSMLLEYAQNPKVWHSFENDATVQLWTSFSVLAGDYTYSSVSKMDVVSNGWMHSFQSGRHLIEYYKNGIVQCAVSYDNTRCFIILTHPNMPRFHRQVGLQFAILLSLSEKAFGLHGVTMIDQNKVIILSAPSGTGKSTLARLLHVYCEAAIVNGDFALLTPEENGSLMFEPTPFCGSSGICHNYRLKVDRIVFLEQANKNTFSELSPMEAFTRLLSNVFVPTWDGEKATAVQQNALRAVASVPMNVFAFAPTGEAAEMIHSLVT